MTLYPQTRDEYHNDLDSARWWFENVCPKAGKCFREKNEAFLKRAVEQSISDVRNRTVKIRGVHNEKGMDG